jgi:hypothetical protein
VPCKTSIGGRTYTLNTTEIPNGMHHIQVLIEDAAGNQSIVLDRNVNIENPTAGSLGATPGPGTNGGGGTILTPAVANGTGASETAQLHLGKRHAIVRSFVRSFAHRAVRLTGWLLDGQGHPITGATLDILQQINDSTQTTLIGHAYTSSTGTFTTSVPAGPSRTLTVAYRAFSTDPGYTTETTVRETVNAGVQLTIAPRETGSNGTILLEGHVDGAIPAQGLIVEMRVRYHGRWVTFRTPQTNAEGYFETEYQFEGGIGRFPFRARIPKGQASFPYATGLSETIDVTTI